MPFVHGTYEANGILPLYCIRNKETVQRLGFSGYLHHLQEGVIRPIFSRHVKGLSLSFQVPCRIMEGSAAQPPISAYLRCFLSFSLFALLCLGGLGQGPSALIYPRVLAALSVSDACLLACSLSCLLACLLACLGYGDRVPWPEGLPPLLALSLSFSLALSFPSALNPEF